MSLLCRVSSCRPYVGAHTPDCAHRDRCRGCLPKEAAHGYEVCFACRARIFGRLSELPQLHEDLLTPTKAHGGGGGLPDTDPGESSPATLAEVRSPAGDGPIGARHRIRATIVGWVKILHDEWQIPIPADDDLRSLIAHVDWWANTLLADEMHAPRFADEIDQLWTTARAHAYQEAPAGQALGECPTCGTMVRATDTRKAACRGCGAERTVDDWRRLLVGDLSAQTAALGPDLCAWLSSRHNRAVQATTIRQWASRGVRLPKAGGGTELVKLGRLGTDQYSRAMYSVADAARIGRGLYGDVRAGVSA